MKTNNEIEKRIAEKMTEISVINTRMKEVLEECHGKFDFENPDDPNEIDELVEDEFIGAEDFYGDRWDESAIEDGTFEEPQICELWELRERKQELLHQIAELKQDPKMHLMRGLLCNTHSVESLTSEQAIDIINQLAGKRNISPLESITLNNLVIKESERKLEKLGKSYSVKYGKVFGRSFQRGLCYANAAGMMDQGYGYVEGFVTIKGFEEKIPHAWNVDMDGNHIDFTFDGPNPVDYFGVVIPERTVYEVGLNRGGVWFAVLPFIENLEAEVTPISELAALS